MAVEIKVPALGESVQEVEIGSWLKNPGETVRKDEPLVVLESDKATVELPSPVAGRLQMVTKPAGSSVSVGTVIGMLQETDGEGALTNSPATAAREKSEPPQAKAAPVMPSAERLLAESGLSAQQVAATGPGGRLLKEDVVRHLKAEQESQPESRPAPQNPQVQVASPAAVAAAESSPDRVVRMTRLRRTIAARLVQAQQQAALLTTFNEVDMTAVMELRRQHGEAFQKRHQVKLGLMSFFVKASASALKQFPAVNAEIRDEAMVYHGRCDIGIAVSTERGLVVPVLRRAETLGFAAIERAIAEVAQRSRENKLTLEELQGGTFSITNGGVFGSLLSTPIVNPPQSAILGLHAIQNRPVAREDAVVIRPMMYLALTYDHRIIDGREAVGFLLRVKELVEAPTQLLLDL